MQQDNQPFFCISRTLVVVAALDIRVLKKTMTLASMKSSISAKVQRNEDKGKKR